MSIHDEHAIETYKSLMLYGSAGLKFVLTANGAAAIAVLTFLGHFVANAKTDTPDLRWPLGIFLLGVLLGGVATITTYMTQLRLYNESIGSPLPGKSHVFWLNISLVVLLAGMVSFGVGALWAVLKLQ